MPLINIAGISINFPFEPYDVQKAYMGKVLECLKKGQNGLLESPTGTGKTLCLLCSSLSWLEVQKAQLQSQMLLSRDVTSGSFAEDLQNQLKAASGIGWGETSMSAKIIYTSRTHSQLSQAIQELKRTNYRYLKSTVIGSREQYCIHPEVLKEPTNSGKLHLCRAKVNSRTCHYYNNVDQKIYDKDFVDNKVLDIEDLVILGKKHNCCPYYTARTLKNTADIIFMPYNYLLDPKTRKAQGVELRGNVVIFDEAHNVEKVCEEAASFEMRSQDLAACIEEVTQVMKKLKDISTASEQYGSFYDSEMNTDFTIQDLALLKTILCELEEQIDKVSIQEEGKTFEGSYIFDLLNKVEVTKEKKQIITELLEKVILYITTTAGNNPFQRKGGGLQKFLDLIQIVFSNDVPTSTLKTDAAKYYKIHIKQEQLKNKQRTDLWTSNKMSKNGRTFNYWCFSPGFSMKELLKQQVHCIILTSGTLSPLASFASELQIPFPIQLENPHIIDSNQVLVRVVSKGPDGTVLDSSFKNRDNESYVSSLGNTIVNFSRIIPDGLLVFFPSYYIMKRCKEFWEEKGIWHLLTQIKTPFLEPQTKEEFTETMRLYYERIQDPNSKGAIFFAVCRGKVSEGLDFADINGRAVIITGLPYPPFKDPRVVLKKQYLDNSQKESKFKGLSGREWYNVEATRAINQAIGRVIRHKDDYGAILLCDSRFNSDYMKNELSAWVRPHIKKFINFGTVIKDLIQFFRSAEKMLPQPGGNKKSKGSQERGFEKASSTFLIQDKSSRFLENTLIKYSENVDTFMDDKKLKENYMPGDVLNAQTASSLIKQKGSCLEMLDNSPSTSTSKNFTEAFITDVHTTPQMPQVLLVKESAAKVVIGQPHKKRRIIIKPRSASPEGQESKKQENKDSVKDAEKDKAIAVKEYIAKVKSSLTAYQYEEFRNALRNHQKNKDIDALIPVLAGVFLEDPRHYDLFRKFKTFIPKHQEEKFDEIVRNLLPSEDFQKSVQNKPS